MRNEMTVTTRSIADESGSTSAATSARKSPTLMNVYSGTIVRSAPDRTSRNTPMATIADAAMAADGIGPVQRFSQRRASRTLSRNAARGNAGMSQTSWITACSSSHLVDLVHVHGRPVAVRGEDDREADRDLRRGDDEDEDDEDAASLVERVAGAELARPARERHEREVARVQHELHAHEDHHRIAADEDARRADEEERRGYRDERTERDGHPSSRLTSTIAPTRAARRSTDATSNGNA